MFPIFMYIIYFKLWETNKNIQYIHKQTKSMMKTKKNMQLSAITFLNISFNEVPPYNY